MALDSFLIRAPCLMRIPRMKHLWASQTLNGLTSFETLVWKKEGISASSSFLTLVLDRRVGLSFHAKGGLTVSGRERLMETGAWSEKVAVPITGSLNLGMSLCFTRNKSILE